MQVRAAQAEGLKFGIEMCRRKKWECSGVMFWQWNEPWPAVSWAVLPYDGPPKIAYQYLKEIYNPILGMLETPHPRKNGRLQSRLIVVNDLLERFENCLLTIEQQGKVLYSQNISLPPNSAQSFKQIESEPLDLHIGRGKFVLKIYNANHEFLSVNTYRPNLYREYFNVPDRIWHWSTFVRDFLWAKMPWTWDFNKMG